VYRLEIKRFAAKEIRRMPEPTRRKTLAAIRSLATDPRPQGCKKLTGAELYRLRVGNCRILYEIDDDQLFILVFRAGHRRDVYRQ
jgi:mRNA interferase RelE/StbE